MIFHSDNKRLLDRGDSMPRKRSQNAYVYCMQPEFENFLRADNALIPEWTTCKDALKEKLGIDTLSALDEELNYKLISRYEALIRKYHEYHISNNPGFPQA